MSTQDTTQTDAQPSPNTDTADYLALCLERRKDIEAFLEWVSRPGLIGGG